MIHLNAIQVLCDSVSLWILIAYIDQQWAVYSQGEIERYWDFHDINGGLFIFKGKLKNIGVSLT